MTPWANVVVVHRKRSPVKRLIELARVGHRLPVGSVNLLRSVPDTVASRAREKVLNGEIELIFCPTDKMMADALSKPVDRTIFFRCMSFILNVDFESYLKKVSQADPKSR